MTTREESRRHKGQRRGYWKLFVMAQTREMRRWTYDSIMKKPFENWNLTKGERGGMDWEIGIGMYTLGCYVYNRQGYPLVLNLGKDSRLQCRSCRRHRLDPWSLEDLPEDGMKPTSVFLLEEIMDRRTYEALKSWAKVDMTRRLKHTRTHAWK